MTRKKNATIFSAIEVVVDAVQPQSAIMIQQVVASIKKLLGVTPHGVESFFLKKNTRFLGERDYLEHQKLRLQPLGCFVGS